jgi:hypothetical protein
VESARTDELTDDLSEELAEELARDLTGEFAQGVEEKKLEEAVAEVRPPYRRVLLKLSGEVFGNGELGIDPDVVARLAAQIAEVVREGAQVAIVVGGGNFLRGAELSQRGGSTPGCRPPSPWARSPSRTSRAGRSGTWRRAGP